MQRRSEVLAVRCNYEAYSKICLIIIRFGMLHGYRGIQSGLTAKRQSIKIVSIMYAFLKAINRQLTFCDLVITAFNSCNVSRKLYYSKTLISKTKCIEIW